MAGALFCTMILSVYPGPVYGKETKVNESPPPFPPARDAGEVSNGATTTTPVSGLPARWVISFYRNHVRPAIGQRCSMHPSCSEYAMQAINKHGALGLAIYADRAVREPSVIAECDEPVIINGRQRYPDPVCDHDWWMETAEAVKCPASSPAAADPELTPKTSEAGRTLARRLAKEGRNDLAAVEYRRLAIGSTNEADRAGYYWAAAYEYHLAGQHREATHMLDLTEKEANIPAMQTLLLRSELNRATRHPEEAGFYLRQVFRPHLGTETNHFAARRLAAALTAQSKFVEAESVIGAAGFDAETEIEAIERYASGKDKKPAVGGLLGAVPGLGYVYSGEYGNAVRSAIINAIFIAGMLDTADDEEWGAFAVLSFFELTWYTGSIYGGIDAAHRHNRSRLTTCIGSIEKSSSFTAEREYFPKVKLEFDF